MIRNIGLATPQYQQNPAFKGAAEVKMLVDLTKDLSERSSDSMSALSSRLNNAKKRVSLQDLKEAAAQVKDWQARVFRLFIED